MGGMQAWNRAVPMMGDDALLLAESNHRVANEVAAALAAMHLVRSVRASSTRWQLLGKAISRLEAFGAVHRQLSVRPPGRMDVGAELDRLCHALADARDCPQGSMLDIRSPSLLVDGETGRRFLMIANELVTNGIRYAMDGRVGRIAVGLEVGDLEVTLVVSDDGPGIDPSVPAKGTGLGTPLVAEIVRRAGGHIVYVSSCEGTRVEVTLPLDPAALDHARAA